MLYIISVLKGILFAAVNTISNLLSIYLYALQPQVTLICTHTVWLFRKHVTVYNWWRNFCIPCNVS